MLGTFTRAFSQVTICQLATSQMCNFQSGNFPNVQFPKRQLPKGQVKPSEAPQAAMGAKRYGQDGLVRMGWEVATWENTLGKLPLGKNSLGNYLTSNLITAFLKWFQTLERQQNCFISQKSRRTALYLRKAVELLVKSISMHLSFNLIQSVKSMLKKPFVESLFPDLHVFTLQLQIEKEIYPKY